MPESRTQLVNPLRRFHYAVATLIGVCDDAPTHPFCWPRSLEIIAIVLAESHLPVVVSYLRNCGNARCESRIERHDPTKKRAASLCHNCLEKKAGPQSTRLNLLCKKQDVALCRSTYVIL